MNSDVLTSGLPSSSTGGQVRRYMMVNPDLYKDLTTRLKFSTAPEVKNLISTDAEIEAILKNPKLPIHEKRDMLSDALRHLQVYKQMIDQDSAASEPNIQFPGVIPFQPFTPRPHASRLFTSTPRSSSQQTRRLFPHRVGVDGDSEHTTMASAAIPTHSAALPKSFQQEPYEDEDHTGTLFGTPEEDKPRASTPTSRKDLYQDITSQLPKSYTREALQTLTAMEQIPGLNIDPTSLQVSMHGRNLGDIAEILTTFSEPQMKTTSVNREAQQMTALLARQTKLPASVIRNRTYQQHFKTYRTQLHSPSLLTRQPAKKPLGTSRRGLPYDPARFKDWQDITKLTGRTTRSKQTF